MRSISEIKANARTEMSKAIAARGGAGRIFITLSRFTKADPTRWRISKRFAGGITGLCIIKRGYRRPVHRQTYAASEGNYQTVRLSLGDGVDVIAD